MEVIIALIIFAAAAEVVKSAPAFPESQGNAAPDGDKEDYYRDKRSGSPYQVVSPCAAAAASAPMPAISPPGYPVNLAPYHAYARNNYYAVPNYRVVDPESELLGFSDMDHMMPDHMSMARYGYATPAAHVPASYAPASTPAHAFSVFPNANVGECSVPLLLSCAPSIAQGHVVRQAHYGYGDSYRGVDVMAHQGSHEDRDKIVIHDHNPVQDQHATGHQ